MAQHPSHTSTDFNHIVILLLLSYVLASAPSYIKYLKESQYIPKSEKVSPYRYILKSGSDYALNPYKHAWKSFGPSLKTWAMKFQAQPVSAAFNRQLARLKPSF